jgi:hypothetical protein
MRVRTGRRHEVVVADELADAGPRHAAEVEERDAAVPEIVRRERRHARRRAGPSECGPKAFAGERLERAPIRMAIVARAQP